MGTDKKVKLEYGKSMYGGWYAQNMYHGVAIHEKTLKTIKEKVRNVFPWCQLDKRHDN